MKRMRLLGFIVTAGGVVMASACLSLYTSLGGCVPSRSAQGPPSVPRLEIQGRTVTLPPRVLMAGA